MPLDVIYDPRFLEHRTGEGHPERAARLGALIEGLTEGGVPQESYRSPSLVDRELIERVHEPAYVAMIERFCDSLPERVVEELPTGDATVGRDSFRIALLAAGAAVDAARGARPGHPAFALVRPPGHHAEPHRGMGFCLLNNIAIAADDARRQKGATLIVDFDYHHGNGTQVWVEHALQDTGVALGFVSTHASPAYPGTGAFTESRYVDTGFSIQIPLDLSTPTHDFVATWTKLLPPLARVIKPKTILVSTGFDFLEGDPIAGLPVTGEAVDALCALLAQTSAEHDAALAFILEGGYSLPNLRAAGRSMALCFDDDKKKRPSLPAATQPHDRRLREMTDAVLRWLE